MNIVKGNIVDIKAKRIYPAAVSINNGLIENITEEAGSVLDRYIIPGFVDAHVHIESSMLIPSQFARLAVVHGTVATVSDPHEIANVCGMKGVEFMIENGKQVPFKFYFGAPSCVPATVFETAGAEISVKDVEALLASDDILYLSEMMNFPGVLFDDNEVLSKIQAAKNAGKPVDGHAPGLRGEPLKKYIGAGITTDHECFTKEEALEKLENGMKILIREGSAAKNFEALIDLLNTYPDKIMFCSDDKHPDSLVDGHINQLCARAVAREIDVFKVLQAACINPVQHYNLKVGQLNIGDPADFVVLKNLNDFEVVQTFVNGELVAENGQSCINILRQETFEDVNQFNCKQKESKDFALLASDFPVKDGKIPVIEALDGQLITNKLFLPLVVKNDLLVSDLDNDILKIVVVNRYREAPIAKAFIKNFGLKRGAIASSVAHDSHNIVAVGVDDESICRAVNALIASKGGVSCIDAEEVYTLALPVAGLMSAKDGYTVAEEYKAIDIAAKGLGSTLASPFMSLSFMALLVIPELKLSDKGLFDGKEFQFIT